MNHDRRQRTLATALCFYVGLALIGTMAFHHIGAFDTEQPVAHEDAASDGTPISDDPARTAGPFPDDAHAIRSPATWIDTGDYPAAAVRDNLQGTVAIGFTVDTDGRITRCTIDRSSGTALLDRTACALVTERGRYRPARDAAGRAVAQRKTLRFTWRLPDA